MSKQSEMPILRIDLCTVGVLIAIGLAVGVQGAGAATFDTEIPSRDNFSKAAFCCWIPDEPGPLQGVVTLAPGLNGDGRRMLLDPTWQKFAKRHQMALMGFS
jgi:hypothetical protein